MPKTKDMLQYEYGRSALKLGLKLEKELGTNPYKFGMIGSTDSHTGLSAVEEDNFFGKHSGVEPSPKRWEHPVGCFGNGVRHRLAAGGGRLRGRVGDREHPRGHLRRDDAPRDLCDDRAPDHRALLRRLRVRGAGRADAQPGR